MGWYLREFVMVGQLKLESPRTGVDVAPIVRGRVVNAYASFIWQSEGQPSWRAVFDPCPTVNFRSWRAFPAGPSFSRAGRHVSAREMVAVAWPGEKASSRILALLAPCEEPEPNAAEGDSSAPVGRIAFAPRSPKSSSVRVPSINAKLAKAFSDQAKWVGLNPTYPLATSAMGRSKFCGGESGTSF